jgi:hypothetical protein
MDGVVAMTVLVLVLASLLTVAYARAVLMALGFLALTLMVFGCVYVVDVLNGTVS